jgi:hypothetical protein
MLSVYRNFSVAYICTLLSDSKDIEEQRII